MKKESEKKVLWISLCAPYDDVKHAGGKIHNYYLKKLIGEREIEVKLITFCELYEYEIAKADHEKYAIDSNIIPWTHEFNLMNIRRKLQFVGSEKNPFQKYGGESNDYYWDKLKQALYNESYEPDIIILQWTQMIIHIDKIKKRYDKAKIIAIEEDVMYLSMQRRINGIKNPLKIWAANMRYKRAEIVEKKALNLADIVIVNNYKDKNLLIDSLKREPIVWAPFFTKYKNEWRGDNSDTILFYGAMSRYENYASAIWFIENVFSGIDDLNMRFVIVGNNPNACLLKYKNDRIEITGYVEDVTPYLRDSLCLVAPLVLGAGIKIKILEALSAGIPVLTNNIGIEGIPIEKDAFFYCVKPRDYEMVIRKLRSKEINGTEIGKKGSNSISDKYDFECSYSEFKQMICN